VTWQSILLNDGLVPCWSAIVAQERFPTSRRRAFAKTAWIERVRRMAEKSALCDLMRSEWWLSQTQVCETDVK
jgi:hypothetical protein